MKNKKKLKCIKNSLSSINVEYFKIMSTEYDKEDLERFLAKAIICINNLKILIDDDLI